MQAGGGLFQWQWWSLCPAGMAGNHDKGKPRVRWGRFVTLIALLFPPK